jgi:HEAT repeat protein
VRLTLEIDGVQEQTNASGLPGTEEVTASLGIRRSTDDGVERIALQSTRSQPVEGDALEGRQEAARRALDEVLDRLVKEARVHLDARKRDDARLAKDLRNKDPLVREAATAALVARHNRAAIPALVEQLKGDDPLDVRRAIGGLVELQAREAVPELIEISRGKDPGFLRELVYALGAIGGEEAEAYLYTMSQGHDQPAVRDAARQALEEMERHGRRGGADKPSRNASLAPGSHP